MKRVPNLRELKPTGPRWAPAILALAFLAAPLAAQPGELRFERLSVEDGLSHSTVRSNKSSSGSPRTSNRNR